jgi:pimeloyl-ACP methyl ester carboxylesterase
MPNIGDFPFDPSDEPPVSWSGPTLFLKGEHSKYINRKNIPVAEKFFPNMQLQVLDAGHWVHAEQPLETVRLSHDFLSKID